MPAWVDRIDHGIDRTLIELCQCARRFSHALVVSMLTDVIYSMAWSSLGSLAVGARARLISATAPQTCFPCCAPAGSCSWPTERVAMLLGAPNYKGCSSLPLQRQQNAERLGLGVHLSVTCSRRAFFDGSGSAIVCSGEIDHPAESSMLLAAGTFAPLPWALSFLPWAPLVSLSFLTVQERRPQTHAIPTLPCRSAAQPLAAPTFIAALHTSLQPGLHPARSSQHQPCTRHVDVLCRPRCQVHSQCTTPAGQHAGGWWRAAPGQVHSAWGGRGGTRLSAAWRGAAAAGRRRWQQRQRQQKG